MINNNSDIELSNMENIEVKSEYIVNECHRTNYDIDSPKHYNLDDDVSNNKVTMVNPPSLVNISELDNDVNYKDNYRMDSFLKDNYLYKLYCLCNTISQSVLHTFLLSIFETVFFWVYITKQEKQALLNKARKVKMIMDTICFNIDTSQLSSILNDYIFNGEKTDNTSLLNISIYLSVVLLLLSLLFYYLTTKVKKAVKTRHINDIDVLLITYKKTNLLETILIELKNSMFLFIFISIYEALFFNLVIRTYEPISEEKFLYKILENCYQI